MHQRVKYGYSLQNEWVASAFWWKNDILHQKRAIFIGFDKKVGTQKVIIIEKGFKLMVFKSYETVTMS